MTDLQIHNFLIQFGPQMMLLICNINRNILPRQQTIICLKNTLTAQWNWSWWNSPHTINENKWFFMHCTIPSSWQNLAVWWCTCGHWTALSQPWWNHSMPIRQLHNSDRIDVGHRQPMVAELLAQNMHALWR